MADNDSYGIGFFLAGHYHILCREGNERRFHMIEPHSNLKPVKLRFIEAREFIETHPLCANIAHHDIRVMPYREIQNIFEGRSPKSTVKSLSLSDEDELEERLH
ncbi:MAG: hypothetical protein HXX11_03175 [Desulfuromonadales bacterium]|nr:hypothetical protein [Desulfuromonadales bacterium]